MNITEIKNIKTISELEAYSKMINEAINERKNFISLCEVANNASKKSFGFIKEAFENISPELFKTKTGKAIINKYVNTIKENKNLSNLHTLYENLRKISKDSDIDFFINNIANTPWGINKKTVNEDVLKLGRILSEGLLSIGSNPHNLLPEEKNKFDNAVKYISQNKHNSKNIADFSEAVKVIREHISKNNNNRSIFENKDVDAFAKQMIESFNIKYSELSKDEKNIIKEFNKSENKEEVFNLYKNDCIKKLTEAKIDYDNKLDNDSANRINSVLEKVTNKKFVIENAGTDICGFMNLAKLFEE